MKNYKNLHQQEDLEAKKMIITTITILCKDNSRRVLRVTGNYTDLMAIKLAKDIEKDNYQSVTITK